MPVVNKILPSGIEPKRDFDAEILRKAKQIGELFYARVETALLDLSQQENFALERLREYTPTDRLLTLKEAAAYLHFAPRTIDSYTAPGKSPLIRFTMIGGEKRFKKLWLDAAIESLAVKPRRGVTKL